MVANLVLSSIAGLTLIWALWAHAESRKQRAIADDYRDRLSAQGLQTASLLEEKNVLTNEFAEMLKDRDENWKRKPAHDAKGKFAKKDS